MVRAPYFDKNGVKKGAWSREEDDKLREHVEKYGLWNWREIPKFAGLSRCGKSCRLRWMNYLRPDVKHGNYNEEEEDLILKLHEKHGNNGHTSESEGSQMKKEMEARTVVSYTPSNPILESTPLSPETSCSELSNMSTFAPKLPVSAGSNWNNIAENILPSVPTFGEFIGDFWTEPFLTDNAYTQDDFPGVSFYQEELFVSYYDDGMDFYNEMMQRIAREQLVLWPHVCIHMNCDDCISCQQTGENPSDIQC
ncbi:hypothetical protein OIU76_023418 [Salix suchowensis]|nr:hypothetical protein OIU76_023418 [Salix suchowensis]